MRIDQTIVPWTALWLFYFEEWLFSDEWKGGGEHPGGGNSVPLDDPHDSAETSLRDAGPRPRGRDERDAA